MVIRRKESRRERAALPASLADLSATTLGLAFIFAVVALGPVTEAPQIDGKPNRPLLQGGVALVELAGPVVLSVAGAITR